MHKKWKTLSSYVSNLNILAPSGPKTLWEIMRLGAMGAAILVNVRGQLNPSWMNIRKEHSPQNMTKI